MTGNRDLYADFEFEWEAFEREEHPRPFRQEKQPSPLDHPMVLRRNKIFGLIDDDFAADARNAGFETTNGKKNFNYLNCPDGMESFFLDWLKPPRLGIEKHVVQFIIPPEMKKNHPIPLIELAKLADPERWFDHMFRELMVGAVAVHLTTKDILLIEQLLDVEELGDARVLLGGPLERARSKKAKELLKRIDQTFRTKTV